MAPDGSDKRSARGRRAVDGRSTRQLLDFTAARGGKEGNKQAYNPLRDLLAQGQESRYEISARPWPEAWRI